MWRVTTMNVDRFPRVFPWGKPHICWYNSKNIHIGFISLYLWYINGWSSLWFLDVNNMADISMIYIYISIYIYSSHGFINQQRSHKCGPTICPPPAPFGSQPPESRGSSRQAQPAAAAARLWPKLGLGSFSWWRTWRKYRDGIWNIVVLNE